MRSDLTHRLRADLAGCNSVLVHVSVVFGLLLGKRASLQPKVKTERFETCPGRICAVGSIKLRDAVGLNVFEQFWDGLETIHPGSFGFLEQRNDGVAAQGRFPAQTHGVGQYTPFHLPQELLIRTPRQGRQGQEKFQYPQIEKRMAGLNSKTDVGWIKWFKHKSPVAGSDT